ncbi:MAG: hypothetical protein ACLU3F_00090 [Blautia wexlerae]
MAFLKDNESRRIEKWKKYHDVEEILKIRGNEGKETEWAGDPCARIQKACVRSGGGF